MRVHPKSAQFYVVKNPDAVNEALYRRIVTIAQQSDVITLSGICGVLRCGSEEIAHLIDRMEREGIVSAKEKYSRRRVLVKA